MTGPGRYPEYRAGESIWLDTIPAHWTLSRFGYEARLNGGQVDPRVEPWVDMTLVAPNHIESGTGRLLARESARDQGADSGKYAVSAGQIVYSKIRPALNKVTVAVEDCLCSADMYAMSFRGRVHPAYAAYQILALPFHQFVSVASGRVKMPKVNREELSEAPWLVPPLIEQRAISEHLEHETAQIDALIGKQERLIDTLRERRAAVVERVVWTGLGSEEQSPTNIATVGAAPSHWRRIRNKNLLRERGTVSTDGSEELLSVSHLTGITPRSEKSVNMFEAETLDGYRRVEVGDLVINTMWAWMGALGVSKHRGIVSPAYGVYEPLSGADFDLRYFDYAYRSKPYVLEMTRFSRGMWTSRLRIYPESFLRLGILVPPLDEQRRIADHLDEQTARIDVLIAKAERFIKVSKERRSALITAAVTGQIDVRYKSKALVEKIA